ncbi:T9SS type A sorting domain-containing protein [Taibaiella helva]|uniref:T9SS type A sorting domain-containing protein n=1 Tax=Taibaiella helva TaxID=2301235 RepID=UPI000E5683FB|nr:T9SS type A sorting domain-containing protein [Taibaiella helva]
MKLLSYIITGAALCFSLVQTAQAQFSINETFRNSTISSGITLGGNAYLTSGAGDPQGQGWLRLTGDSNYQAGYAVIQQAFPSAMGVLVDFEYVTWSRPGAGNGADGISLFLFDAAQSESFHAGGYGGSLGYSKRTEAAGLSGGYLGLGLDEFGNYSNPTEGRVGGPGFTKNAVALRGPAPDYAYLSGNQVISDDSGNGDNGGIDYNTTTATRPTASQFYRRVQISLEPYNGTYRVTVKWKKHASDPFTTLFGPVTMTSLPPAMLKLGLASSTGAQHNFHEIRNLIITTPGNISVDKQGPEYIDLNGGRNNLSYDITVSNGSTVALNDIQVRDLLPAGYALSVDTGISIENYGNPANTVNNLNISNGVLSGTASIAANSEVTLHLRGVINGLTVGQSIRNTVRISSASIQDQDTTNNVDTVYTLVQAPLPVTLSSFTASPAGSDVLLSWVTAMEINNDHFEIERSADGKQFQTVGHVKGSGDTKELHHYELRDAGAMEQPVSALYYRLKQVDRDGRSEYSVVRQVSLQHEEGVVLYPVPFNEVLNLRVRSAAAAEASVAIYSIDGRQLVRQAVTLQKGYNEIALKSGAAWPAGMYTVEYTTQGQVYRYKVAK